MPLTPSAIKKLRHDRNTEQRNDRVRKNLSTLTKAMRKAPSKKALTGVFQALDKAAKNRVIHKNTASRLKSRLSRLLK